MIAILATAIIGSLAAGLILTRVVMGLLDAGDPDYRAGGENPWPWLDYKEW